MSSIFSDFFRVTAHGLGRTLLLTLLLVTTQAFLFGQTYDLVLKNGRVIDPANSLDQVMDVAIKDGRIAKVDKAIESGAALKYIDVRGLIVTPGLIDIHTHVFVGGKPDKFADGTFSVSADDFCPRSGVTTVVDAGTSGWKNFEVFKYNVIDRSKTRILAFLNIAGKGMSGDPDQQKIEEMNTEAAVAMAQKYPEWIVGFKIGHYEGSEWSPFDRTIDAGNRTNKPVLVECHLPQYPLAMQLQKMRKGDIITHSFEEITEREPVIDGNGNLRPYVVDANKKGVLFDVGHGGYGFWFSEAIPALREGLEPNTLGTDLHRFSINAGMKSMTNLMSKYLAMGMSLNKVLEKATVNAARAIKRPELGSLSPGNPADIAVFSLYTGDFGFTDAGGNRLKGKQKLETELTIRDGSIIWDLNGRNAKPFLN
ncbi:MAG: amidohydrolase/deacetylase family metallohydrolase [Bacteroidetes bacterium]|nr:amidohydrolase/deacetylase family metallohydrolase [Bacteroidota bacterium]